MATTIETNFIPLDLDVSNQSGSFELGDTPATNVANPITTNENPTSVNTNIIPSGGGSIVKGFLKTQNFNTGVSGWSIDGLGNVEFNDGNFRGDITGATGTFSGTVNVGSLNIPDTVTANSFHVNTDGDAWWGATAIGSAVAKIEKTGKGTFTDIIATGTINAQGGYLASGVYIGASNALLCEATGLNVGVTGHVRGGQTDYDTGTGFWLGYDTAAYKLSIGDSTDYLTWNGTNLDTSNLGINETFTAGEALVAGDFVFIGGDSKAYKIDGHTSELDDRFLGAATATIS